MTLVKWKTPSTKGLNGTSAMASPLSELFDNFFGENLYQPEYSTFVPSASLSKEESLYLIELSAPGFSKEQFKMDLDKGVLTITGTREGEKEVKEKNYSRKEFSHGSFTRRFSLPEGIKEEAIEARYENGILKISLPKVEEVKKTVREIKIS